MTNDKISLRVLQGEGSDAGFLRGSNGFAAQRQMDLKVGDVTGADHGERNSDRMVQRNGAATATGKGGWARWNFVSPS